MKSVDAVCLTWNADSNEKWRMPMRVRYHMLTHMKRTTLLLDDGLYAELRRRAAADGLTLTAAVERALRLGLTAPHRRARITLPSYDLGPFLTDLSGRAVTPPDAEEE
jgi:plasmid stability protein